ncbi:MAG: GspH/FimT family pseudopilin [Ottowia sp.]|uniref:GspH/FimT family pseudopilin n=1 Tax=Ottowia sp. TaxID=1898956 RepID=UPI0039E2B0F7
MEHPPIAPGKRRPLASRGFTAIELMVVIAIVAILAALALPSFNNLIKKWQLNQDINALIDTIYFARSEAVKWGGNVQIARLPNSASCTTGSNDEWSCGWQVVLTSIPSGAVGVPADGVLKRVQANEKNFIYAPSSSSTLSLNRWGNPGAGYNIHILHKKGGSDLTLDQYLCLSSGGRLRQADSCS